MRDSKLAAMQLATYVASGRGAPLSVQTLTLGTFQGSDACLLDPARRWYECMAAIHTLPSAQTSVLSTPRRFR